jgi:small-conductance mechanosensitive channel
MKLQTIQRIHGIFLVVLASGLVVFSTYAQMTGNTVYGFLHENPMGQVGLIQAYLLMVVIGCTLLLGSSSMVVQKRWDIIGIIAHIPPLVALALYGYLFIELGISYMIMVSIAIHSTWITIELLALLFLSPKPKLALQS